MSWRAGAKLFWDIWPKVKDAIPETEFSGEFTTSLLTLFLDCDLDPCEMRGGDPEIDTLMNKVDPEL
jgi:hypothetical protein